MPSRTYDLINAFVPRGQSAQTAGNPAAVIVLPPATASPPRGRPPPLETFKSTFPSDESLHAAAKELDQPMTSYLVQLNPGEYLLRWFSAGGEAPMCGHGTVAAAQKLFATGSPSPVTLHTPRATLYAEKAEGGIAADGGVAIRLPEAHKGVVELPAEEVELVRKTLEEAGGKVVKVTGIDYWIIAELDDSVDLKDVKFDVSALNSFGPKTIALYQIPKRTLDGPQIQSRVFPWHGDHYPEDFATGSAHAVIVPLALTTHLNQVLAPDAAESFTNGQDVSLKIRQRSSRGGEMVATWLRKEGVVRLEGRAEAASSRTIEMKD